MEQEGAKEFVTYLNRLYREGLLDADYPSNKNETMAAKVAAGQAGACRMTPWESATLYFWSLLQGRTKNAPSPTGAD